LTVGHKRFDSRIWLKEITSLVSNGYKIIYLVADGDGNQYVNDVEIRDFGNIPQRSGFRRRMRCMYKFVSDGDLKRGDIVHFHDGVFLPLAFLLWMRGCKIVYDVHEDYPRQVLNTRFHPVVKKTLSLSFSLLEWLAGRLFSGIIAATPKIAQRFPSYKTVIVQNFPLESEFIMAYEASYADRPQAFAYVGGITTLRGIKEMITAVDYVGKNYSPILELAGSFSTRELEHDVRSMSGWKLVNYSGWLTRQEVSQLLGSTRAGLVLFHPVPNHIEAQPNKMFEYMAAGLPVIASDFPLWRKIIDGSGCGLLVDPMNPEAIAEAMSWVLEHPIEAAEMGRRGKEVVRSKYNWDIEANKLTSFYQKISH